MASCLMALTGAVPGCDRTGGGQLTWEHILSEVRQAYPDVRFISTGELASWLADADRGRPLLLDVRELEEYRVSHLHGAVPVESDQALDEALRGVGQDQPIVVYCSVGYRSAAAARAIRERGYADVANLEGSIFAWANEGRPVYLGDERVSRVHPYDDTWGVLLDRRYHPPR